MIEIYTIGVFGRTVLSVLVIVGVIIAFAYLVFR